MSLIMKNGEAYGKGGGGDVSGRAMSTAIAPEFNPSESYVVGDKVMHEDEYYVFTADHTGAWDDADVDLTDVDSEIPKAMSEDDLDDVKDAFVPNTGAPLRMMNYSTEEQVVGTWIDGKPLYQKTFVVDGSLEFTANSWLSTSIVIDDGEAIIDAELVDRPPNGMARAQIWGVFNPSTKVVSLLMSRSNNYPHGAYVTLRYTKTND